MSSARHPVGTKARKYIGDPVCLFRRRRSSLHITVPFSFPSSSSFSAFSSCTFECARVLCVSWGDDDTVTGGRCCRRLPRKNERRAARNERATEKGFKRQIDLMSSSIRTGSKTFVRLLFFFFFRRSLPRLFLFLAASLSIPFNLVTKSPPTDRHT